MLRKLPISREQKKKRASAQLFLGLAGFFWLWAGLAAGALEDFAAFGSAIAFTHEVDIVALLVGESEG